VQVRKETAHTYTIVSLFSSHECALQPKSKHWAVIDFLPFRFVHHYVYACVTTLIVCNDCCIMFILTCMDIHIVMIISYVWCVTGHSHWERRKHHRLEGDLVLVTSLYNVCFVFYIDLTNALIQLWNESLSQRAIADRDATVADLEVGLADNCQCIYTFIHAYIHSYIH